MRLPVENRALLRRLAGMGVSDHTFIAALAIVQMMRFDMDSRLAAPPAVCQRTRGGDGHACQRTGAVESCRRGKAGDKKNARRIDQGYLFRSQACCLKHFATCQWG
ncbi:hypothetical protein AB3X93_01870 [Paraburkholderia sp. BR14262]|uniref:hypothetical protein n=1 Tax=Paraburkholderia sp. BR14262 TaxID=3236999 RepID=UPI0034CD9048